MSWLTDLLTKIKGGLADKLTQPKQRKSLQETLAPTPTSQDRYMLDKSGKTVPRPTQRPIDPKWENFKPGVTVNGVRQGDIKGQESIRQKLAPTPTQTPKQAPTQAPKQQDNAENIRKYFEYYKAPLSTQASSFSKYAKDYNLDYRIGPVISMLETSGGKHLKSGINYNIGNVAIRSNYDYNSFDEAIKGLVSIIGGREGDEWSEDQKRNASYYEDYRKTITPERPEGDLEILAKIFEPANPNYAKNLTWGVENFTKIFTDK